MTEATSKAMRHAVLGAGGIGGLIGACLARSGDAVTLVVRPETLVQYPKTLRLESAFGNFAVDVEIATEVPAADALPIDVLWITVKATQLEAALGEIKKPDSVRAIVPLLNGIDHIALLRARYGAERVIPATIAVEAERVTPGHIIHRSPFARLQVSSAGQKLLGGTLDQLQRIGFECHFVDNEPTLMWGKLVFLAPFALTTTAANKTVGEILADPYWRNLGEACVREACAVGIAEGASVDAGKVLAGVVSMPANMRSSMMKDVAAHKAPELDAIAGPILRGAQRNAIDVPATKKLVAAVQDRAGYPAARLISGMPSTTVS
jgi:2-dehydropantoate 2-reductase